MFDPFGTRRIAALEAENLKLGHALQEQYDLNISHYGQILKGQRQIADREADIKALKRTTHRYHETIVDLTTKWERVRGDIEALLAAMNQSDAEGLF